MLAEARPRPLSAYDSDDQRSDVLGLKVSAINMQMALDRVDRWIENGEPNYICVTGVHGVMESQRDAELLDIHNRAGMVTPDGMPLVWLSRLGGHNHVRRVYGPDLMLAVCEKSREKGYRHFLYGGGEGVAEKLAVSLRERFPGIQIAGTYCPPFRPLSEEEDQRIVREIDESGADIVWVGLSTPKQERWMDQHVGRLKAPVLAGVGAAFDFNAGLKKQAPKWMQENGLEWLFRMVTEPRRLGKRYLKNNPLFLYELLRDRLRLER